MWHQNCFLCTNTCGTIMSIFQHLIKYFFFVLLSANAVSHLEEINFPIRLLLLLSRTSRYEILCLQFIWSLYLLKCIIGRHECHFVYMQSCFSSALRVQRWEEVWLLSFLNSAIYGGKLNQPLVDLAKGKWPGNQLNKSLRDPLPRLDDSVKVKV